MPLIASSRTDYDSVVARDEGLGQLFHRRVLDDPTAVAIQDKDQRLTYGQLHDQAVQIAQELGRASLAPEEPVGILVQHGVWDAVTQMGVIYAAGTCVPLDDSLSDEAISQRLHRLGVRCVLADRPHQNRQLAGTRIVSVEDTVKPFQLSRTSSCYPAPTSLGHRTHIIHTSGSTSEPKAVQIMGGSIAHVAHHAPLEPMRKSDVVAHCNRTTFDVALYDIFAALLQGATIVVVHKEVLLDIAELAIMIRRERITVLPTTAALIHLAAATCPDAFAPLRLLMTGGEAVKVAAVDKILQAGPPESFVNAYGPTECCVFCLAHKITPEDVAQGTISIGKPVGRSVAFVCDAAGDPVAPGEVGELLVGGPGVSPGYINQPEKNATTFVTFSQYRDPTGRAYRLYRTGDMVRRRPDGQHVFGGRQDHQVKVRGFRIELDAVDAALMETGRFSDAVTVRIESADEAAGSALVAFVVLHSTDDTTAPVDATKALQAQFPSYMIPHIEIIPEMPLNSHAKVERRQLAKIYLSRRERSLCQDDQAANGHSTQDRLAGLWRAILATPQLEYAPDDDFFVLGGTSLQASLLISRIRGAFETDISLLALYDHSTLARLSVLIDTHRGSRLETTRNERDLWLADTHIADDLPVPAGPVVDWRQEGEGRVLLTGATGFVGAFLLADLLKMPDVHQVACLVRAADAATARQRLQKALVRYQLWQDGFASKLWPLCGNLEDRWLGLGEARFREMADWASVVFHLGARVNYTQPYSLHRPANIVGTANVARLACTGRTKGLHYCSSISCFGPTGWATGATTVYEDEDLMPHLDALPFDHGYAQSQWVAEELLWRLIRRGYPAVIYRPGFITGHTETGSCNPDDFFSRLLRVCAAIGCYPSLPNQRKEFVPVDYVTTAMIHIASSASSLGHAFHLLPPSKAESTDMNNCMELLSRCRGGGVQQLEYGAWIERLSSSKDPSLQPLLPMLAEKVHGNLSRWELYENMPRYDTKNTEHALSTLPGGLEFPVLDAKLMNKYLRYLSI